MRRRRRRHDCSHPKSRRYPAKASCSAGNGAQAGTAPLLPPPSAPPTMRGRRPRRWQQRPTAVAPPAAALAMPPPPSPPPPPPPPSRRSPPPSTPASRSKGGRRTPSPPSTVRQPGAPRARPAPPSGSGEQLKPAGRAVPTTERVVRVGGVEVGRGPASVGGHRRGRDRQREATAPPGTGWRWWPHREQTAYRGSDLPRAGPLVYPWRCGDGRRVVAAPVCLVYPGTVCFRFPHSIGCSVRFSHAIGLCVSSASACSLGSLSVRLKRHAILVSNDRSLVMRGSIRDSRNEHATGTRHEPRARKNELTKTRNEYSWHVFCFGK